MDLKKELEIKKTHNLSNMSEESFYNESLFENIKHINEYGQEFWYARELQTVLQYKQWRRFCSVIEKAKEACKNSNLNVSDHFANLGKMVNIGSGAARELDDYELSRYACYLIVQNGDSRKKVIALGQTYFAVKTRQQELIENYDSLDEDQKRLAIRKEMSEHNKLLVAAAKGSGVETKMDYAIFQNYGYMGYEELAANLFRATQTEAKLRREQIQGKENANNTHLQVGKKVRQTIADLGGTMPENLPTPSKSIKQIEREQKHLLEN